MDNLKFICWRMSTATDMAALGPVNPVVVMVGDGEVGKTCLVHRLLQKEVNQLTVTTPTIIDHEILETNYLGSNRKIEFIDTSGQENYEQLSEEAYSKATIICLCYAVNNYASFTNITNKWLENISKSKFHGKIILIATKSDLRNDPNEQEKLAEQGKRFVSANLGNGLKKTYVKMVDFLECSALTDAGSESIQKVLDSILKHCFGTNIPENLTTTKSNDLSFYRRCFCCCKN